MKGVIVAEGLAQQGVERLCNNTDPPSGMGDWKKVLTMKGSVWWGDFCSRRFLSAGGSSTQGFDTAGSN